MTTPEADERPTAAPWATTSAPAATGAVSIGMLLPRLLVIDLTGAGPATALASPDSSLSAAQLGVTCVRLIDERTHEPTDRLVG